jgi:hypothetical protein
MIRNMIKRDTPRLNLFDFGCTFCMIGIVQIRGLDVSADLETQFRHVGSCIEDLTRSGSDGRNQAAACLRSPIVAESPTRRAACSDIASMRLSKLAT